MGVLFYTGLQNIHFVRIHIIGFFNHFIRLTTNGSSQEKSFGPITLSVSYFEVMMVL